MVGYAPADSRPLVVYVAGCDRSGSTLLNSLVGQVEGVVAVGELWAIWDRAVRGDQLCSCSRRFSECDFWRAVDHEFGGFADGLDEVLKYRPLVQRYRHLPRLLVSRPESWPALHRYGDILARLYSAIARVSGCRVIVDTSKHALYAHVLSRIQGIDVNYVHLVRDPRAVAFSLQRSRRRPEITDRYVEMQRRSASMAAAMWMLGNGLAEALRLHRLKAPLLRIRYEDVTAAPADGLKAVVRAAGIADPSLVFLSGRTAAISVGHSVAGNPVRFRHGVVSIEKDEEWRACLSTADKRTVSLATWPLMVRYGYRWDATHTSPQPI